MLETNKGHYMITKLILGVCANISQCQSCSQRPQSFWLAPRNCDLLEKLESEPALSGNSLYACSETIIELECMCTMKLEPGFSSSGF